MPSALRWQPGPVPPVASCREYVSAEHRSCLSSANPVGSSGLSIAAIFMAAPNVSWPSHIAWSMVRTAKSLCEGSNR